MKEIYESYLDSNYEKLNDLSKKGYENAAKGYKSLYKKFLPKNKDTKILDIGCGTGYFLYFLEKEGYRDYYGIDISKQQIDFCKENVTENVEAADAFEFLNDKKNSFDVIVMNDLLEHIPKSRLIKFLNFVYVAIRNSGTVIIKVPNMSNPFGLRSRYIDVTHDIGFTEDSLSEILNVVGFKDIDIYPTHAPIITIKSQIRRYSEKIIHRLLKLLFLLQGYSVPRILTKNIVAIAKK